MTTSKKVFIPTLLALCTLIGCAGQAKAEPLNIDFGRLSIFGAPSSSYGAASGQLGAWNEITTNGLTSNLVGLDGNATNVSLSLSSGEPNGYNSPPSPDITNGTSLMNDYFYSYGGGSWSVSLSNLSNGVYDIFVYAPANSIVDTGPFSINGTPFAAKLRTIDLQFAALPVRLHHLHFDVISSDGHRWMLRDFIFQTSILWRK